MCHRAKSYKSVPGLYAGSNYCQSHVLVDTWMLTVQIVPDDLKWATNTHLTPFTLTRPQPVLHISTPPYSFLPIQRTGGRVSR